MTQQVQKAKSEFRQFKSLSGNKRTDMTDHITSPTNTVGNKWRKGESWFTQIRTENGHRDELC